MGKTLAEVRQIPPADYHAYRRFYSRQPFGPVRGDLQAWLTARNAAEAFVGKLKQPSNAVWGGGSKRKRIRRRADAGPKADAESLKQFAEAAGVPWTPGLKVEE